MEKRIGSRQIGMPDICCEGQDLAQYPGLCVLPCSSCQAHPGPDLDIYFRRGKRRHKGKRRYLRNHSFPWMFPRYAHGSKHFLETIQAAEGVGYVSGFDEDLKQIAQRNYKIQHRCYNFLITRKSNCIGNVVRETGLTLMLQQNKESRKCCTVHT